MKSFFLIIFLLVSAQFNQLFSQFTSGSLYNNWKTLAIREANSKLTYSDIEGTPFYSDEFIKSTVYLNDGSYANVALRYDIFQDEIEFMQENKTLWVNKKEVRNIRYGSEMMFVSTPNEDSTKLAYFFLLGTGKYLLYVQKKIIYYPEIPPKGYANAIPQRFERDKDEYYLKAKGLPAKKFNSKKSLLAILSDNGAAQSFIKKEKIKADNPEDLKKLVGFLNSD